MGLLMIRRRLAEQQYRPLLSQIVTDNEKWCLYVNAKNRKEWFSSNRKATPQSKADTQPRTLMLWIW